MQQLQVEPYTVPGYGIRPRQNSHSGHVAICELGGLPGENRFAAAGRHDDFLPLSDFFNPVAGFYKTAHDLFRHLTSQGTRLFQIPQKNRDS